MAGEVTILQLQNAALDAETLAEVCMVGYTADTTTNRDGDVINTLQGQLKLLGYIPPIAYADSIAFLGTENTKTIERSGIVYAPLPSALPFTTSGTWSADDEDKFFTVQVGSTATVSGANVTVSVTGLAATNATAALQELENEIDAVQNDVGNLVTLTGVAVDDTTMGTFTGSIIPDSSDIKECLQALETKAELSESGTWTPTLTGLSNIYSLALTKDPFYTKIGGYVTVSGAVEVDTTTAAAFSFRMTLPIASNFDSAQYDAIGFIANASGIYGSAACDIANNEITFGGTSSVTFGHTWKFSVTYRII